MAPRALVGGLPSAVDAGLLWGGMERDMSHTDKPGMSPRCNRAVVTGWNARVVRKLPFPKYTQHTDSQQTGPVASGYPQRSTLLALLERITLENEMHLCFSFCWAGSPPKLCVDTNWSWKSTPLPQGNLPLDRSGIHQSGNYRSGVYPTQTRQAVHRLWTHKL